MVNAPLPAALPCGLRWSIDGTGFWPGADIVKLTEFDVPPPGVGLRTVTTPTPALATSAAWRFALSSKLLTNVVVRLEPFQRTTELGTKSTPVTLSTKAPLPAT